VYADYSKSKRERDMKLPFDRAVVIAVILTIIAVAVGLTIGSVALVLL